MTFDDIWGHTSFYPKYCLYNVDILKKKNLNWALNKKYIVEKEDFENIRWPYVTFNDHWGHTLFGEKSFIKLKSRNHVIMEFFYWDIKELTFLIISF